MSRGIRRPSPAPLSLILPHSYAENKDSLASTDRNADRKAALPMPMRFCDREAALAPAEPSESWIGPCRGLVWQRKPDEIVWM